MKLAVSFNLYAMIIFLLIQFSSLSYAQVSPSTDTPSPLITNNQTEMINAPINSLSLLKGWNKPIINHSLLSANEVSTEQKNNSLLLTHELFTIDKVKGLQQQINLRFQTGLYSLKNNYALSSHYPVLISNQFLVPNLAQHDLYQFGRFHTEMGYNDIANVSDLSDKNFKAFLHSAYSLINHGRFNLSVTASIESIELVPGTTSLDGKVHFPLTIYNNEQSTSATLGVIGSFDLTNHWSLIGVLTTSHLTNNKYNTLVVEESRQKRALIGTTYSF
ncbi:hypothetical protein [Cognaticolwellia mytili]|uniref:hypothetical protein n=1 Tax=Cognaticolwellia mytili TaxID=1888913 RepID=UPI000A16F62D|nr:hypothetical protein [Cognaticolwellia mytili]